MKPEDITVAGRFGVFKEAFAPLNLLLREPTPSEVRERAVVEQRVQEGFYAGFAECFKLMSAIAELTPPEAVKVLNGLQLEVQVFLDESLPRIIRAH